MVNVEKALAFVFVIIAKRLNERRGNFGDGVGHMLSSLWRVRLTVCRKAFACDNILGFV